MFFHSPISLLVFIPAAIVGFWILDSNNSFISKYFLLVFSLFFYGFDRPWFLLPLLWSALTDYYISDQLIIHKDLAIRLKRLYLLISILSNISLLFSFKYIPLVAESFSAFGVSSLIPEGLLRIAMPAGISFYTFQTLSYVFDAYKGKLASRVALVDYLVYVCYFPQLVAGPILRPNEFFSTDGQMIISASKSKIFNGFQRICFGLVLKLAFADELARLNDIAYSSDINSTYTSLDIITMAAGFGLQIYFDFSAYSHMAIGISELVGLPINENFNFPYLSRSSTEFWRRWHISLSKWIGDYLYSFANSRFPLGLFGSIPLMVTWLIMGLWHGASWRFACWGLLNAFYILIHRIYKTTLRKSIFYEIFARPLVSWFVTNFAIMLSWIYFRATSWDQANNMVIALFNPSLKLSLRENYYLFVFIFGIGTLLIGLLWENRDKNRLVSFFVESFLARFFVATACLVVGLIFINRQSAFIYFQF